MAETKNCCLCGKLLDVGRSSAFVCYGKNGSTMMTATVLCSKCDTKVAPAILQFCKAVNAKCDCLNYDPDEETEGGI